MAPFGKKEGIDTWPLRALTEVKAATNNLCAGLDELVPDDAYADWAVGRGSLKLLGYTREGIIALRKALG